MNRLSFDIRSTLFFFIFEMVNHNTRFRHTSQIILCFFFFHKKIQFKWYGPNDFLQPFSILVGIKRKYLSSKTHRVAFIFPIFHFHILASYLLDRWYYSQDLFFFFSSFLFKLIVNGFTSFVQWCAAHNFQIFFGNVLLYAGARSENGYSRKWKIYNSCMSKRMRLFHELYIS